METKIGLLKQAMALVKQAIELEEYGELEIPLPFKITGEGLVGLVFGANQVLMCRSEGYEVYQNRGSTKIGCFVIGRTLKNDEKMKVGHWYFIHWDRSTTSSTVSKTELSVTHNYVLCIGDSCKTVVNADDIVTMKTYYELPTYKIYCVERKFR